MAEEVRYNNYRRYICIIVACIVIFVSSSTKSLAIVIAHFKNEFQLEQEAGIQIRWKAQE